MGFLRPFETTGARHAENGWNQKESIRILMRKKKNARGDQHHMPSFTKFSPYSVWCQSTDNDDGYGDVAEYHHGIQWTCSNEYIIAIVIHDYHDYCCHHIPSSIIIKHHETISMELQLSFDPLPWMNNCSLHKGSYDVSIAVLTIVVITICSTVCTITFSDTIKDSIRTQAQTHHLRFSSHLTASCVSRGARRMCDAANTVLVGERVWLVQSLQAAAGEYSLNWGQA